MTCETFHGLAPLAARYDAFIVDLWGTVHDGIHPLPGAVEALASLQRQGKQVAFLSNVPRRVEPLYGILDEIGVHRDLYDHAYSSGQETWDALATRPDDWYRSLGRRAYYIGPTRHGDMTQEHPAIDPSELDDADFALCIGPREGHERALAGNIAVLEAVAARGLRLICANPDRTVFRGGERLICAGALADHFEHELGGEVRWHGKPYPSVFQSAQKLLGEPDPHRVLVIGDSLTTDIAGANAVGMPSALLFGGIHAEQLGIEPGGLPKTAAAAALFAEIGQAPTYGLPALSW